MTKITKAVFPAAGLGTRFLPATKAIPKEMMPIGTKPLIQFAAEEAVRAGITTLIFVTGRNKRAIADHFDANLELEDALRKKGKDELSEMVRNILPEGVECVFVRQAEQLGLGHAVLCAERVVGDEPFAVLLADDFLPDDASDTTSQLVGAYHDSGKQQLSVMQVDGPSISKYGVIKLGNQENQVAGLVEKPDYKDAPSNLASIGRYVLSPKIFDVIRNLPKGAGGEIQLADAIDIMAKDGTVESQLLQGRRFDCGSVQGYYSAMMDDYERYSKKQAGS